MSLELVVFLDADLNVRHWAAWSLTPEGTPEKSSSLQPERQGDADSWAEIAAMQPEHLVVVLPAAVVYHSQVAVPSHDPRIVQQSIPWAVEEELASAVEDNHVAWRAIGGDAPLQAVAVIEKGLMKTLLSQLDEHGLMPRLITSELACLPVAGNPSAVENRSAANQAEPVQTVRYAESTAAGTIIRTGPWQGGFIPAPAWPDIHETKLKQAQAVPTHKRPLEAATINLLQGDFAPRQDSKYRHKRWRGLALAALGLLMSLVLVNGIKYWRLQSQYAQVKSLQLQTLRKAFVAASPAELADPVNAMRSRLKAMESAQGQGSGALTSILAALSQVRQQVPAVRIQALHWRDNALEIQLMAPTIDTINRFAKALGAININWQVTTGTREAVSGGIKSVLVVRVLP